jgi:pimeloyl-ACP methyl ester carboxylesterase
MHLFYTHGTGGSLQAQPEIDDVFAPLGYTITRIAVPYHGSVVELATKLATMTFGDLCLLIHETADTLIAQAKHLTTVEYVVIGDSLGGLISVVAAQRDASISHCVLLACSGDICNAALHIDEVFPGLGSLSGVLNPAALGGLKLQAHKAIAGQSDFQREFELVNTFRPERVARLRRLLILGDKGDPVMRAAACRHFAKRVKDSTVIMAYNERRHHTIGQDALRKYAVPFLQNRPLTLRDRLRKFFALVRTGSR